MRMETKTKPKMPSGLEEVLTGLFVMGGKTQCETLGDD